MKVTALLVVAMLVCRLPCGLARAAELTVVGTGDGVEMLYAISAVFNAEHPDLAVTVPPSIGSGGAIAAVGAERYVLGRVARPLSEQEQAQGLLAVPIVKIPSAIFVNPSAGVNRLSSAQLAAIYTGQIENWREVGGADLKIKVVRREEADSTLGVLRATMAGWRDLTITSKSKLATTTQDAVAAVKLVQGAIGFGPYSRSLEDGLVVVSVDGRLPLDSDYPSAITLALLHKQDKLSDDARKFMAFMGSAKAQNIMLSFGGIPVTR